MIPILVMIIGLAASALLHFLYRNTYTDYERIDGVKVWTKRVTLKRKDFVLELGIVPLICNHLLKSNNDNLLTECAWIITTICYNCTSTQVMIMNFNEK